ncbi:MAG: DAK2 domain-containing protein [Clostridiales bacterium]|nr:DAK2 domain-containing protein [Clostridiales bacterium]
MGKTINGSALRKMFSNAFSLVEEKKKDIDALNVFPVPDGDTGTNMSLTLKSAVAEMNACESNTIESICVAFNRGALKGARGNSGVITSQIIKGICSVLMSFENEIQIKDFARAIQSGAEMAYKAVTVPKEGTILTIIKAMAEKSKQAVKTAKSFEDFLSEVLAHGESTLQMTPDMLPVLKKAGVVDAGGRGLMYIFSGFYKALTGEMAEVEFVDNVEKDITSEELHVNYQSLADIKFAYCTEFFIINIYEKTTDADINTLRTRLMEIGDCVLCIGDLQLVKVHVHTNEPNRALGYALQLGELNGVKIENMLEQNRQLRKQQEKVPMKEYGMIVVAAGEGLSNVYKDIDVDYVISGGQTMNPSANDIATAADKVNAKNIFVFPNNKNIIMSAEQANDITDKNLIVVPTKSIPEGVSAVLAFDANSSIEENKENMMEVISTVRSGSVTYAVRTTNVDGIDVKVGDIMGLDEHSVLTTGSSVTDTTIDLVDKLVSEDSSNVTLFYGEGVTEEDSQVLQAKLEERFPNIDISIVFGGQPVYYYIISVE